MIGDALQSFGWLVVLWSFVLGLAVGLLVGMWAGGGWYRRRLTATVERARERRLRAAGVDPDDLRRMIEELERDVGKVDELDLLLASSAAAVAAIIVYVWLN